MIFLSKTYEKNIVAVKNFSVGLVSMFLDVFC